MKTKIGAERFLVEIIDARTVEAMARKNGWRGVEGLREFCEPEDAAIYTAYKTKGAAEQAARTWLATGHDFYGCVIIDRQIYRRPHDDRGNLVRVPPVWETEQTFEVAMDGETIDVAA